ncbi:2Fe-2S iron-sulfur cluster-binding protein [Paraburkholderia elongata]|uniref:2Fe-2S iron-sulfur cluster binding domain-containing protein n=1 Tax=Paraburkholderia elongata TaxID=2675747 RepID=A0A972NQB0_9BURK|nr:2Fe-2S iron-sulfur cluster binding domain-containing protein [Paraburkholderia elongata]NPT57061.1 2Fe-2S iron-sulfur cluster binding domain-containing protein [Paraburkholderia elongata]
MRNFLNSLLPRPPIKRQVQILPQGVTIDVASGQTLLEAALANGVHYPHNCTVGTCASCKTLLRQGRVREATPFGYTLSKQELDAGYILACQAFARDDLTVVEIAPPSADLPAAESYAANIVAAEPLTHDILKVTMRTDRPVNYVAGQYASVLAPGLPRSRHYSFADAPQRGGRTELAFFIRKVRGGAFTDALFSGSLTGQSLAIEAPHGSFYLRGGNAPMVCVAGGSGLAPLLSILEDARRSRIRRPCTLLFGARTQADLYMLDAIRELAGNWLDPFEFIPVLSHDSPGSPWKGARGLVSDFITAAMADGAEGYLCGPPPMIDAGIAMLVQHGVTLEAIYYDKFTDGHDGVPGG